MQQRWPAMQSGSAKAKPINSERLSSIIEKSFLTKSGQEEARKVL